MLWSRRPKVIFHVTNSWLKGYEGPSRAGLWGCGGVFCEGTPSSIFGMSIICDPELNIKPDVTNALVTEWNQIFTVMFQD